MNNNFSNPNRVASLVMPILAVMVVLFMANLFWHMLTRDDYDDESITVEFHCPTVLSMKENYPTFVINECKKLHEN